MCLYTKASQIFGSILPEDIEKRIFIDAERLFSTHTAVRRRHVASDFLNVPNNHRWPVFGMMRAVSAA